MCSLQIRNQDWLLRSKKENVFYFKIYLIILERLSLISYERIPLLESSSRHFPPSFRIHLINVVCGLNARI